MTKSHVYLVDDDPGALRSVAFLLERHGYGVTAFAEPGRILLQTGFEAPACLVTDYRMPGMTGIDLFRQLRERGIQLPTIIITAFGDIPTCSAAIRGGIFEFLEKPAQEDALLGAVEGALLQASGTQAPISDKLRACCELHDLTPREAEVLARVVAGNTLKQIAREFGTTIQTVSKQRIKLYEKLGVTGSVELIHRLLGVAG